MKHKYSKLQTDTCPWLSDAKIEQQQRGKVAILPEREYIHLQKSE